MRDDGDFLKDLRAEVISTQQRRHQYIRAKVVFVVGLLGVGVLSPGNTPTNLVLYLTTIVVLIFDLYILGEDFGVKRAGTFFRLSRIAPTEERRWERLVHHNRDPFSAAANVLSSLFVLLAATIGLWGTESGKQFFWFWIAANFTVIGFLWWYGRRIVRTLKEFAVSLERDYEKIPPYTGDGA